MGEPLHCVARRPTCCVAVSSSYCSMNPPLAWIPKPAAACGKCWRSERCGGWERSAAPWCAHVISCHPLCWQAGRVIVLCTHFMEEADILGDRIAVMAHGSLRVAGSSLYLKNRFGLGYHLTMAMHEGADVDAITATIHDHVPRATKEVDLAASAMSAAANREANRAIAGQDAEGAGASAGNGAAAGQADDATLTVQVSYVLPMDAIQQFAGLFQALEDQRGELGIESYGLSSTCFAVVCAPAAAMCTRSCVLACASDDAGRGVLATGGDRGARRVASS